MRYRREASPAKLFIQVYRCRTGSLGPRGGFRFQGPRKVEVTQEVGGSRSAPAEQVDNVDILRRCYGVGDGDDMELYTLLHRDENFLRVRNGRLSATNDPLEVTSHSFSLAIVGDLGPACRAPVLHNKTPGCIEGKSGVVVADAGKAGENHVAVRIAAKDEAVSGSWDVAEPGLDACTVAVAWEAAAVFWWFRRLTVMGTKLDSSFRTSRGDVRWAGPEGLMGDNMMLAVETGVDERNQVRIIHIARGVAASWET